MNMELQAASNLLLIVPAAIPGDESLLPDDEICKLIHDGEGGVEAAFLRLRDELISGQGEPQHAVAAALSRFTEERADRLKVLTRAVGQGRVSDAIFTLNRVLAYSFWQSDYRFAAWGAYLDSLPQGE